MANLSLFGRFLDAHNGALSAVAAIFIAIFTVILAWKTWDLHTATRGLQELGALQSKDMKESIAAANRSADAAKDSNSITRDFFITEQRAWISVNLEANKKLEVGNEGRVVFGITLNLKNHGRNPAANLFYDLTLVQNYSEIVEKQNSMINHIRTYWESDGNDGIVVFPGEEIRNDIPVGDDPDMKFNTSLNYVNRVIVGVIRYSYFYKFKGETRFAFVLGKKTPSRIIIAGIGPGIQVSDKIIPADDVVLKRANIGNAAK